ncbi:unnamed protein product, partial [Mesorhabditis belari]|uniref:Mitochondrial carrier protein n=1 Tax=Mesorhabditis belari TaxID=2138241 RepID=A0AAF3FG43_9BILA
MDREAFIHFIGGAVGGTAGTAFTCPLEVIKTRLQSSKALAEFSGGGPSTSGGTSTSNGSQPVAPGKQGSPGSGSAYKHIIGQMLRRPISLAPLHNLHLSRVSCLSDLLLARQLHTQMAGKTREVAIFKYIKHIIKTEGFGALYKGLVPNLIGVAPSKAVYFYTYSTSKRFWNDTDIFLPNSAIVHMLSAGTGGMVAATVVNPIWLVKTRLQLHHGKMGIWAMVKRVHQREGFRGFYRGVTASYAGVSETMIQFVLYEYFRQVLLEWHGTAEETDRRKLDFLKFVFAGGGAKFIACVIAYPHEVVRTRLREEGSSRKGFFGTLYQLYREGWKTMYRGLSVQLMRTVPSTAITMTTYETFIYLLHQLWKDEQPT